MAQTTLDLGLIILLDKVQKGQRVSVEACKKLKAAKLVEAGVIINKGVRRWPKWVMVRSAGD